MQIEYQLEKHVERIVIDYANAYRSNKPDLTEREAAHIAICHVIAACVEAMSITFGAKPSDDIRGKFYTRIANMLADVGKESFVVASRRKAEMN